MRLDKPDYGRDVNRDFCRHVLAQFKKFEPELLADNDLTRANALLILIGRTVYMMDKYIRTLGEEFKEDGGFRERMTAARTQARTEADQPAVEGPPCPLCGGETRLRHTRKDSSPFWGCLGYPRCKGTIGCPEKKKTR